MHLAAAARAETHTAREELEREELAWVFTPLVGAAEEVGECGLTSWE